MKTEKLESATYKYLKRLHQDGVKHPFDQWYVKRAEAFLRSSPKRLSERAPGDVEAFFRSFGRKPGLKGWRFRQIVDATRTLMEVTRVPWRDEETLICWPSWPKIRRSRKTRSPGSFIFRGLGPSKMAARSLCHRNRE